MIGGAGFSSLDIRTEEFLIENNMDDILLRISYDYELYGNFALNIIWSRDRQSIAKINYIDVSKVRVMTPELGMPVVNLL